jgi:hypothetical protein
VLSRLQAGGAVRDGIAEAVVSVLWPAIAAKTPAHRRRV